MRNQESIWKSVWNRRSEIKDLDGRSEITDGMTIWQRRDGRNRSGIDFETDVIWNFFPSDRKNHGEICLKSRKKAAVWKLKSWVDSWWKKSHQRGVARRIHRTREGPTPSQPRTPKAEPGLMARPQKPMWGVDNSDQPLQWTNFRYSSHWEKPAGTYR